MRGNAPMGCACKLFFEMWLSNRCWAPSICSCMCVGGGGEKLRAACNPSLCFGTEHMAAIHVSSYTTLILLLL